MPTDLPIEVQDRRKRGHFEIDNILLDAYGKLLGPHAIAVYAALARFANKDEECWPSRRAISERTGVSPAQVTRELSKLAAYSLIASTPQYNERGDQTSNLYMLLDIPSTPLLSVISPPSSDGAAPLIRQRNKQSPKKKDTHKVDKKKNYRPDEYNDVII